MTRIFHSRKFVINSNVANDPTTENSCLKLHNKYDVFGMTLPSELVIVSDNSFRGGSFPVNFGPQNTDAVQSVERVQQIVCERNLITVPPLGLPQVGQHAIRVNGPDIIVRNNWINGTRSPAQVYTAIAVEKKGNGPAPHRAKIYNNTVYRDGAPARGVFIGDGDGVEVFNNLILLRNAEDAQNSDSFYPEGSAAGMGTNLWAQDLGYLNDPGQNDFSLIPCTLPIDNSIAASTLYVQEDYLGQRRPVDGDGDGSAIVDIGGFEAPEAVVPCD